MAEDDYACLAELLISICRKHRSEEDGKMTIPARQYCIGSVQISYCAARGGEGFSRCVRKALDRGGSARFVIKNLSR